MNDHAKEAAEYLDKLKERCRTQSASMDAGVICIAILLGSLVVAQAIREATVQPKRGGKTPS